MRTTAHNAHRRKRQARKPRVHGTTGQFLRRVHHVISQSALLPERRKRFPYAKPNALFTLCRKRAVHFNHFLHAGQLRNRHSFRVLYHILYCYGIEVKRRRAGYTFRCFFFPEQNFLILRGINDVAVEILNPCHAYAVFCRNLRFNEYAVLRFSYAYFNRDFQFFRPRNMFRRNMLQTFQPQRPVTAKRAQCRRHFAAQFLCARNGTGKGVFIHAAVHCHFNVKQSAAHSVICPRRRKRDCAHLCHAKSRFQLVFQ